MIVISSLFRAAVHWSQKSRFGAKRSFAVGMWPLTLQPTTASCHTLLRASTLHSAACKRSGFRFNLNIFCPQLQPQFALSSGGKKKLCRILWETQELFNIIEAEPHDWLSMCFNDVFSASVAGIFGSTLCDVTFKPLWFQNGIQEVSVVSLWTSSGPWLVKPVQK